jgi:hypothetical protein
MTGGMGEQMKKSQFLAASPRWNKVSWDAKVEDMKRTIQGSC